MINSFSDVFFTTIVVQHYAFRSSPASPFPASRPVQSPRAYAFAQVHTFRFQTKHDPPFRRLCVLLFQAYWQLITMLCQLLQLFWLSKACYLSFGGSYGYLWTLQICFQLVFLLNYGLRFSRSQIYIAVLGLFLIV